jgi:NADPH2:quinone reductase
MKAILCKQFCDPRALLLEDTPPPKVSRGQVRIAVEACGVNFADTLIIAGKYQIKPPFPFAPGAEVAGVVLECGKGVTRCRDGDRVMAVLDYGGYAEQALANESDVYVIPQRMDYVTGAGFPVTYGTSHVALDSRAQLKPGEVLVVHGAGGGVGITAVEIGKAMGAKVIATAGSPGKLEAAAAHGADHLINYRQEDIRERVKSLTEGRGADVVYDAVGGEAFEASLRSINWGGRILIIGFASGKIAQIPANILMVKNVSAVGVHWGSYRQHEPERLLRSFTQLFAWYDQNSISPHISSTFPLAEAPTALEALRTRKATGKIVLTTGQ